MNKGEEMRMFNMISGLEIEVLGVQGLGFGVCVAGQPR